MKDENTHTIDVITAAAKNLGEGIPPMDKDEAHPLHMILSYKDDYMQKKLSAVLGESTLSTMLTQTDGKPFFSVVVTRTFKVEEDGVAIETTPTPWLGGE